MGMRVLEPRVWVLLCYDNKNSELDFFGVWIYVLMYKVGMKLYVATWWNICAYETKNAKQWVRDMLYCERDTCMND